MFTSITAILVSRFLMNLQEVKRRTQHQQSLDSFQPSIEFSRVLGAIESTLRPDDFWPPSGEVPGEKPAGEHNEHVDDDAYLDDVQVQVQTQA